MQQVRQVQLALRACLVCKAFRGWLGRKVFKAFRVFSALRVTLARPVLKVRRD